MCCAALRARAGPLIEQAILDTLRELPRILAGQWQRAVQACTGGGSNRYPPSAGQFHREAVNKHFAPTPPRSAKPRQSALSLGAGISSNISIELQQRRQRAAMAFHHRLAALARRSGGVLDRPATDQPSPPVLPASATINSFSCQQARPLR